MSLGSSRNYLYFFQHYTFNKRSTSTNLTWPRTSVYGANLSDTSYLIGVRVLSYCSSVLN